MTQDGTKNWPARQVALLIADDEDGTASSRSDR